MSIKNLFLKILLVSFFAAGCKGSELKVKEPAEEPSPITWTECGYQVGDHLCNFALVDQNGDTFDLYENYGRPMVVDLSTAWCGYCQVAAREITEIQNKYSEYGLIYVTILIEDHIGNPPDVSFCEDWATTFGILDSPVLAGSREMIDYPSGENGFLVTGWPYFIFLTPDLVIDSELRGYSSSYIDEGIQNSLPEL